MPRYTDEWLTDRVLFDYVSGGSCACCGFVHFLPNGTADLITALTDLETDQANAEIKALDDSPWPPDLRDQVWSDRVRLRQKLKADMSSYKEFWDTHEEEFVQWCHDQGASFWRRHFQLARNEIMDEVRQKYNIHSAFGVVLCAVVEQVAFFDMTGYPDDGRGSDEIDFEKSLAFMRQGGFTIQNIVSDGIISKEVLQIWLNRMKSLGGPKLLQRFSKTSKESQDDNHDQGEVDEGGKVLGKASAGFASDRRVIRLIIVRFWADSLQKKFLHAQLPQEDKSFE
ncbi:hypothetical protein FisN_7Lh327 [Fistulifera solaris]|uniref:Uncharacterized protein n=1 Tax=Fistulifera solaris TaxID=1519565 RepID=A0A1Z5JRF2_FISSO|nr:hypothetical protein FisN_7Lh327 [Fistulifera solaris]|eukprot:GAX16595.1 hypothetical protein FisN_7Lh327 [Fistulifera solaris]